MFLAGEDLAVRADALLRGDVAPHVGAVARLNLARHVGEVGGGAQCAVVIIVFVGGGVEAQQAVAVAVVREQCVGAECALFENRFAIVQVFDVATFTVEVANTHAERVVVVEAAGFFVLRWPTNDLGKLIAAVIPERGERRHALGVVGFGERVAVGIVGVVDAVIVGVQIIGDAG